MRVPVRASAPRLVLWRAAHARKDQSPENQQARQRQQTLNTYHRAYDACTEGRDYTIK
jgi:hypothetical protein